MAQIKSGAGPDILVIDPVALAARTTLYNSAGTELDPPVTGSYLTKLEVLCTGAPVAGVRVFNLKGSQTKKVYIRHIRGTVYFGSTVATGVAGTAAATLRFGLYRGVGTTAAISPSGGTVQTITRKDNQLPPSSIGEVRSDLTGAGLTTTNITYDTDACHVWAVPAISYQIAAPATSASHGIVAAFDIDFQAGNEPASAFTITGATLFEHLAIRVQTTAGIAGFGIFGSVSWDER